MIPFFLSREVSPRPGQPATKHVSFIYRLAFFGIGTGLGILVSYFQHTL